MENENYIKIYNLIGLITIISSFYYIRHLSYINKKLESINKEKNKNKQDESLEMCYKSRNLIYSQIRKVNDSNLITIQQKLNYLMIHESPDQKSKIVDKILLHNYSIEKLGKDICVPIIKIYNDSKDIKIDELPDKFVLKCNHGSAMNIICNNKSKFNLEDAKSKLNVWKNTNFGLKLYEFQYINTERKIFAETYLKDNIEDYKIYCFHGNPKFIRVQKHLEGMVGKVNNYYDLDWKLTDIETGLPNFFRRSDIIFNKPSNFKLMIRYAKKLSEDFVFVRVDFYNINGKIYLGEMTFSPSSNGFHLKNREQSIELGKLINLDKINKKFFN